MKIASSVRRVARASGFAALTLVMGTGVSIGLAVADDPKKASVRDFFTGTWSRGLLGLFGVELVIGHETADAGLGAARVVISNHRSIIDIAILLSKFGGAVLSRGDLERWPIIGAAARGAGTIFVDRSDKASGHRAIEAMAARLQLGDTICLFPEGTTFSDDAVRPFKPGGFVAAMRAGVPVVPVGIAYPLDSDAAFSGESFMEHLSNLAASKRTRVFVEVGAPMRFERDAPIDEVREQCRQRVAALIAVAREKQLRDVG